MKFTAPTAIAIAIASSRKPVAGLVAAGILVCQPALADEFRVTDAVSLQAALNSAASNEVNDNIYLADGLYNTTDNNGSFVFNDDSGYELTLTAENTRQAILDGAGIHEILVLKHARETGTITLNGLVIRNGSRGARIENASVVITGSEFAQNILKTGTSGAAGGGLSIPTRSASVVISDTHFTGNQALPVSLGSYGGAAFLNAKSVQIRKSRFYNNQASGQGGALSIGNTSTNPTLVENCEFDGNRAGVSSSSHGGAISALYPLISRNNVYSRNHAQATVNKASQGGAVFAESAVTSSNDIFSENSASIGGALRSDGHVTIANAVFRANEGTQTGAALAIVGILGVNFHTVHNTLFIDNRGSGAVNDATVYCYKNCHLVNSLFDANLTRAVVTWYSGMDSGANLVANSVFLGTTNQSVSTITAYSTIPRVTLMNNYMDESQIGTPAEYRFASGNFFAASAGLDEHHQPVTGSILIDNGLTQPAVFQLPSTDHAGNVRTAGMAVDVGPYESNGFAPGTDDSTDGTPEDGGGTSGGNEQPGQNDKLRIEDAVGGGSANPLGLLILAGLALLGRLMKR